MKYSKIVAVSLLFTIIAMKSNLMYGQETQEQMAERLMKKLNGYQSAAASITDFGALSGLWKVPNAENPEFNIRHIIQFKDVLFYYSVDKTTGELSMHGFAEQVNGAWTGWWSLVCKKCCPGVGWWDKGTLKLGDGGIQILINSFKMDPNTCKLTTTPDQITIEMSLIKTTDFKEHLPGKLIHIVAAPAVGGQPAQYKASVKLKWDLTGLGISYFQLAAPGQMLVNNGKNLVGEYEYLTTKPGKADFLLVAYNSKNQFLHLEIRSITIPAIPGL